MTRTNGDWTNVSWKSEAGQLSTVKDGPINLLLRFGETVAAEILMISNCDCRTNIIFITIIWVWGLRETWN